MRQTHEKSEEKKNEKTTVRRCLSFYLIRIRVHSTARERSRNRGEGKKERQ